MAESLTPMLCSGCGRPIGDGSWEELAYVMGIYSFCRGHKGQIKAGSVIIQFSCPHCRLLNVIEGIRGPEKQPTESGGD